MRQRFTLGKVGQYDITAAPSAVGGLLFLWLSFGLIGRKVFRLRLPAALIGGLLAAVLHFMSELWHQAGHARAAEHTGYPMDGVRLWGVLGTSLYPPDEPTLPAEVHVRRALGGPQASAGLAVAAMLLMPLARRLGGIPFMLTALIALENLIVFTLGAFLPLPFMETDGSVVQRYRNEHRRRMVIISE